MKVKIFNFNTHTYNQKFYIDISNVDKSEFRLALNVPFFRISNSYFFGFLTDSPIKTDFQPDLTLSVDDELCKK